MQLKNIIIVLATFTVAAFAAPAAHAAVTARTPGQCATGCKPVGDDCTCQEPPRR
ncbi:hypothetical protein LZ32DRAFT_612260 [Colletotrichum eremochloae]|nr:hypothetical protein LZ32DRAFT_612260 [Colletotrichum eremochloae]